MMQSTFEECFVFMLHCLPFEIFFIAQSFHRDNKSLALTGFHELFKVSIHTWLQTVHEKTCERIHRAIEVDKVLRAWVCKL